MAKDPDKKPGPDPERLKLEGDWEERVDEALKREKPPEGWPDSDKGEQREKPEK